MNVRTRKQGAGAKVWLSGNTVSENVAGLLADAYGGPFESAGNNALRNSGTDKVGVVSPVSMQ